MINYTKIDNDVHNIYIIKTFDAANRCMVKIGFSKNLKDRLKVYHSNNPFVKLLYLGFHSEGKELEKQFHRSHNSVSGKEWYTVDYLPLMINYFRAEGGSLTEWQEEGGYLQEPWNRTELKSKQLSNTRYIHLPDGHFEKAVEVEGNNDLMVEEAVIELAELVTKNGDRYKREGNTSKWLLTAKAVTSDIQYTDNCFILH